jgi:hypothetical protein
VRDATGEVEGVLYGESIEGVIGEGSCIFPWWRAGKEPESEEVPSDGSLCVCVTGREGAEDEKADGMP